MKKTTKIITYFFAAINIVIALAMAMCAYYATLGSEENYSYSFIGMTFPIFLILNFAFLIFWLIFKRRFMLISIAALLICIESIRTYCPLNFKKEIPEGALKILSYNVLGFNKSGADTWEDNKIANYIKNSNADIVCLQESVPEEVIRQVFDSVYPYSHSFKSTYGPNLSLLSKYPIIETQVLDLGSQSNISFSCNILLDSDTLIVINNHLESNKMSVEDKDAYKTIIKDPKDDDNESRYDSLTHKLNIANSIRCVQTDSLYAFIERLMSIDGSAANIICAGDFNAPSLSYTHYKLTRLLNDAYTRSGNGPGISYNRSGMYFRIDNILMSPNIDAFGAKVDNSIAESDHYPIFSYFKIGKK